MNHECDAAGRDPGPPVVLVPGVAPVSFHGRELETGVWGRVAARGEMNWCVRCVLISFSLRLRPRQGIK